MEHDISEHDIWDMTYRSMSCLGKMISTHVNVIATHLNVLLLVQHFIVKADLLLVD